MFSPNPANSISRTVQYRKITKPLLERKRRARINRCLDELKDLMFSALEAEGENVDKLEKADILEFTVKHLQKITRRDPVEEAYKFQEGFSHCASEACSFLLSLPGLDSVVGRRLVEYLAKSVSRALESQLPSNKQQQQHPAAVGASISPPAAAVCTMTAAAAAAAVVAASNVNRNAVNINNNQNVVNINNNQNVVNNNQNVVNNNANAVNDDANAVNNNAEAIARGHTPPSSLPPPTPPGAAGPLPPTCPGQQQSAGHSPLPFHKPVVALAASNRGPAPHTVVRPKPTRPAFGRSASSSPPNVMVAAANAAAAAAAAQRDPMWRPW